MFNNCIIIYTDGSIENQEYTTHEDLLYLIDYKESYEVKEIVEINGKEYYVFASEEGLDFNSFETLSGNFRGDIIVYSNIGFDRNEFLNYYCHTENLDDTIIEDEMFEQDEYYLDVEPEDLNSFYENIIEH